MPEPRATLPQQLLEPEEYTTFVELFGKIAGRYPGASPASPLYRLDSLQAERDRLKVDRDTAYERGGVYSADKDGVTVCVVKEDDGDWNIRQGRVVPAEWLVHPAEHEMRLRAEIATAREAESRREREWRATNAVSGILQASDGEQRAVYERLKAKFEKE